MIKHLDIFWREEIDMTVKEMIEKLKEFDESKDVRLVVEKR